MPGHVDDFCVEKRVRFSDGFAPELMEFPEPACLRPFVAEMRGKIVELDRLGQILKAVLQISPANGGSTFGFQRDAVASAVVEGIHFLFHDIGALADAAREKTGVFKRRGFDALVAVKLTDISRFLFDITPVSLFFRQDILSAAGCVVQCRSPLYNLKVRIHHLVMDCKERIL